MKKYAQRLFEIGFRESNKKPNLFYWSNEYVIVFADMRGYKDNWGRFIPIWDKKRNGKPRFYHEILNRDKKFTGKVNRILWEVYKKIKESEIQYIEIGPFLEIESLWKTGNIPISSFFLNHSEIPLVVEDPFYPYFFYSGVCILCGIDVDEKALFCTTCSAKIPINLISDIKYLMKGHFFHRHLEHNRLVIPLSELKDKFHEITRKEKFKRKFIEEKSNTCRLCGSFTEDIVKHHIRYDPPELLKVCRSCHGVIHNISFPNPYWKQKIKKFEKCAYCGKRHTKERIYEKHIIFQQILNSVDKEKAYLKKIEINNGSKRNLFLRNQYNEWRIKKVNLLKKLSSRDKNRILKIAHQKKVKRKNLDTFI